MANIPELKGGAKAEGKPQEKPINDKCPVNGEGVDPKFTVTYQGKVIAFCSRLCYNKFVGGPAAYIGNVPGFQTKKPDAKKEDGKAPAAAATGPCDVKHIVKGWYCSSCKRELDKDDLRNNLCKRCETKPTTIEYCSKGGRTFYQADCHPSKTSDKPLS